MRDPWGRAFSRTARSRGASYVDSYPIIHFPLAARALNARRDLDARFAEHLGKLAANNNAAQNGVAANPAAVSNNFVKSSQGQ